MLNSTRLNIKMELFLRSLSSPPCSPLSSHTLSPELLLFRSPHTLAPSPLLRQYARLCPGPSTCIMAGKLSQGDELRQLANLTPSVFHLSSTVIQQCLTLGISHIFHLFSSYCTWKGKSSPCNSILVGSRNCKSICNC